jgi:hypothetical protein
VKLPSDTSLDIIVCAEVEVAELTEWAVACFFPMQGQIEHEKGCMHVCSEGLVFL